MNNIAKIIVYLLIILFLVFELTKPLKIEESTKKIIIKGVYLLLIIKLISDIITCTSSN